MAARFAVRLAVPELLPDPLPVRASVSFPAGAVPDPAELRVVGTDGRPLPSQARVLGSWPDGSVRHALLVFEAASCGAGAGIVVDPSLETPAAGHLSVRNVDDGVALEAGPLSLSVLSPPLDVDERDRGVLTEARFDRAVVTATALDAGLVVTEADGRVYSSQKAGPDLLPARFSELLGAPQTRRPSGISIVESGPVRALVRIEGRTAHDGYRGGLDYLVYLEAYAGRSLLRLAVTWIHRDAEEARFVREIRFRVPLAFDATEAVFGTEKGPCRVPVRHGRRFLLLQKGREVFEAGREDWDGRRFDLANGAANGRSAPGWARLSGSDGRSLSCFLPAFSEEHPTGLSFSSDSLDILLWPAQAGESLAGTRVLPALEGAGPGMRHRKVAYECLAHHPYTAFFDVRQRCLETVQGMQKTREVVFELDPGVTAEAWAKKCAAGALELPLALPAAGAAYGAQKAGAAHGGQQTSAALARAADWFAGYAGVFGVSGAFDRGDLYYLVHDDLDTGPWRKVLEEHARSGYWNNNEEDPVHGLFLYARHTGSFTHQRLAETMARHLWDIDVRHCAPWGVHTHTEGHCFRSQTWSATDHFWLEGLLDYYHATGAPDVREGVREIAMVAASALEGLEPARSDLRSVSLAIAQALRCAEVLDDAGLLEKARALARAQAADVTEEGFFTDYGSATGRQRSPSLLFGTLFLEAIVEVDRVEKDEGLREAALRQTDWFLDHALGEEGRITDPAETWSARLQAPRTLDAPEDVVGGLQLLACLGNAWQWTGRKKYAAAGNAILSRFQETFRAPLPGSGHGQIRPLVPATALRCIPVFLDAMDARRG